MGEIQSLKRWPFLGGTKEVDEPARNYAERIPEGPGHILDLNLNLRMGHRRLARKEALSSLPRAMCLEDAICKSCFKRMKIEPTFTEEISESWTSWGKEAWVEEWGAKETLLAEHEDFFLEDTKVHSLSCSFCYNHTSLRQFGPPSHQRWKWTMKSFATNVRRA